MDRVVLFHTNLVIQLINFASIDAQEILLHIAIEIFRSLISSQILLIYFNTVVRWNFLYNLIFIIIDTLIPSR